SLTIPEGTALGELTSTATADGLEATDTVVVVAGDPGTEPSPGTDTGPGPGTDPGTDPEADTALVATPGAVAPGDAVTVEGSGYEPGSTVTIVYTDSEGTVLAERDVVVDEDGTFTDTFVVPDGAAVGELTIEATGEG